MTGLRLTCPLCRAADIPEYVLPTASHRVISFWLPGKPGEICRWLECTPELGKRAVKWWNEVQDCTCDPAANGLPDCSRFRARHPKVAEGAASS